MNYRVPAAIIAILGWVTLIAQFILTIENTRVPVPETVVRYFSYYTILTNLLVAIVCTRMAFGALLLRKPLLTAVLVYIVVVAAIYNTVLRFLWKPEGMEMILDEMLHTIIPVLYGVFWFLYADHYILRYKNIFSWMIYPLVYLVYILIRGASSKFYPYPFVDVNILGLNRVLVNCAVVAVVFLFLSLLFVAIARHRTRQKNV